MPDDLTALISQLDHADPQQRLDAAERLLLCPDQGRAAAVALVTAAGDNDEAVREAAVAVLDELGPPQVADLDQLAELLDAPNSDTGYWAATLIGRLREEAAGAVPALVRVIAGDQPSAVRERVVWALGRIGPAAQSAKATLEAAAQSGEPRLARLAERALDQIS